MGCLHSRRDNSRTDARKDGSGSRTDPRKDGPGCNGSSTGVDCLPAARRPSDVDPYAKGVPPTGNFTDIKQMNYEEIGLTYRQVFSLKQSWKGIKRKMEETGVEMFVRLFKTNSELQTLFQSFKHIQNDDELRSSEALGYHATLVMATLDDAITHIDNYEFVRQLLTKTGASHIKFPLFQSQNFMKMKEPFLGAVRVTLGDRYTDNMQNIYTVAITFILETLVEGMEEAMDAAGVNGGGRHETSVG